MTTATMKPTTTMMSGMGMGTTMPTMTPAMTTIPPAMTGLTVAIRAIAAIVAMHGGSTFQTNMFSTVKTAFEVAVMRLVSMPGRRSEK